MKTRTGLQYSGRFAVKRERSRGMRRLAPSSQLSVGIRLRRLLTRFALFFMRGKSANPASDNSLGDYINLPKEFLESLDRDGRAAKAK